AAAANAPGSAALQSAAVDRASDLVRSFGQVSSQAYAVRAGADKSIADQVSTVNDALRRVEALNSEIRMRSGSGDVGALADERQRLLDTISQIIPIRLISRDSGEVAVYSAGGAALLDGRAYQLG